MSQLSMTCVIKQVLAPETDSTGQKPFVNNLYYVETVEQYPEKAIIGVFDKDGTGAVWQNVLSELGHFPAVADPVTGEAEQFECYFHLDAAVGTSSRTGKPYSIMKPLKVWKFGKPVVKEAPARAAGEPVAYNIPQFGATAPQQGMQAPLPQNNFQKPGPAYGQAAPNPYGGTQGQQDVFGQGYNPQGNFQ